MQYFVHARTGAAVERDGRHRQLPSSWVREYPLWRRKQGTAIPPLPDCQEIRHLAGKRRRDDCISRIRERGRRNNGPVLLPVPAENAVYRSSRRRCGETALGRVGKIGAIIKKEKTNRSQNYYPLASLPDRFDVRIFQNPAIARNNRGPQRHCSGDDDSVRGVFVKWLRQPDGWNRDDVINRDEVQKREPLRFGNPVLEIHRKGQAPFSHKYGDLPGANA